MSTLHRVLNDDDEVAFVLLLRVLNDNGEGLSLHQIVSFFFTLFCFFCFLFLFLNSVSDFFFSLSDSVFFFSGTVRLWWFILCVDWRRLQVSVIIVRFSEGDYREVQ